MVKLVHYPTVPEVGEIRRLAIFKLPLGSVISLYNKATFSLDIGSNTGKFKISAS